MYMHRGGTPTRRVCLHADFVRTRFTDDQDAAVRQKSVRVVLRIRDDVVTSFLSRKYLKGSDSTLWLLLENIPI